ncbi:MAG: hypothetical protein AVDCRST_MAG10-3351, partial [uncultured Acidimicrobiales bacterium]
GAPVPDLRPQGTGVLRPVHRRQGLRRRGQLLVQGRAGRPCHPHPFLYPRPGTLLRSLYLAKRSVDHLRFADVSVLRGKSGYVLWRLGAVDALQRRFRNVTPARPQPVQAGRRRRPDIRHGGL